MAREGESQIRPVTAESERLIGVRHATAQMDEVVMMSRAPTHWRPAPRRPSVAASTPIDGIRSATIARPGLLACFDPQWLNLELEPERRFEN